MKIAPATFIRLHAKKAEPFGFLDLVASVFEYPFVPEPLRLAAQQIEMNVVNKDILHIHPLQKIEVVDMINDDDKKSGHYTPETNTISIRENMIMRMTLLQVFIHEYGHHLDETWLHDRQERLPAVAEYEAEKKRVENLIGEEIGDDVDDQYKQLLNISTSAVAPYSLRTSNEWMADAFALYFSGYGPRLHQLCPATHDLIDGLCKGTLNVIQAGGPPSDKGPGSGHYDHKHDVTLYHGTDAHRIQSILEHGLDPYASKQYGVSYAGTIYATEKLEVARRFAAEVMGDSSFHGATIDLKKGVVLKLALSQAEYDKFWVDPSFGRIKSKALGSMTTGLITPDHIVGVSQVNLDDGTWSEFVPPDKFKLQAANTITVYAPYFGGIQDVLNFCNSDIEANSIPQDEDLFKSELQEIADGVAERRHAVAKKLGVQENKKYWSGAMPRYELKFGGNFGHAGRPGQRGGSAPKGALFTNLKKDTFPTNPMHFGWIKLDGAFETHKGMDHGDIAYEHFGNGGANAAFNHGWVRAVRDVNNNELTVNYSASHEKAIMNAAAYVHAYGHGMKIVVDATDNAGRDHSALFTVGQQSNAVDHILMGDKAEGFDLDFGGGPSEKGPGSGHYEHKRKPAYGESKFGSEIEKAGGNKKEVTKFISAWRGMDITNTEDFDEVNDEKRKAAFTKAGQELLAGKRISNPHLRALAAVSQKKFIEDFGNDAVLYRGLSLTDADMKKYKVGVEGKHFTNLPTDGIASWSPTPSGTAPFSQDSDPDPTDTRYHDEPFSSFKGPKVTGIVIQEKVDPKHILFYDGILKSDFAEDEVIVAKPTNNKSVGVRSPKDGTKYDRMKFGGPPSDKGPGSGHYEHKHKMTQVGPQGGSNPGGVFKDENGVKHYVKFYGNMSRGKTEVLANKVYDALGIPAAKSFVADINGKPAIAAPMIPDAKSFKASPSKPASKEMMNSKDLRNGFVADAYLSNYDVIGLEWDNAMQTPDGTFHRIDNGGSLFYRAQGLPKNPPSDSVPELDTMRDPNIARQAGQIFKSITDAEMKKQSEKLISTLTDEKITQLVHESGFEGEEANKNIQHLIGRREALAKRFGIGPQTPPTTDLGEITKEFDKPLPPMKPKSTGDISKPSATQNELHKKAEQGGWKFLKYGLSTKLTKYESADGKHTLGITRDGKWTIFDAKKNLVAKGKQDDDFNDIKAGGPPSAKGPGSGHYEHKKNPYAITEDELREAYELDVVSKNNHPQEKAAYDAGVALMVRNGLDKRLIVPVSSVRFEDLGPDTLGQYAPDDLSIRLREFKASDEEHLEPGTVIHEFGHHLDWTATPTIAVWADMDQAGSGRPLHGIDTERMYDEKRSMLYEMLRARKIVSDISKENPNATTEEYDARVPAPSAYSISNPREYFAEAFRFYMLNDVTRKKLQEQNPATYKFIDNFTHGKYFKETQ